MIPQTFYDWHQCITVKCGIQLTPDFVQQRLEILENNAHPETVRFKELYGEKQLFMTISWFRETSHLIIHQE